jgi:hypothetical protein
MPRRSQGLLPLAAGLAAIAGGIAFLLARDATLGRWALGGFLVAHGLVHILFLVPPPAPTAGAALWPFDVSQSWLAANELSLPAVRILAAALVCLVVVGFLLAGLATVGVMVAPRRWPTLIAASAIASIVLLALFPSRQLALGLVIDAGLCWTVVVPAWAP